MSLGFVVLELPFGGATGGERHMEVAERCKPDLKVGVT